MGQFLQSYYLQKGCTHYFVFFDWGKAKLGTLQSMIIYIDWPVS